MTAGFATGKRALAICQRCGFQCPWRELRQEEGTYLYVCNECDDKQYNRSTHPQNGPFPVTPDPQALAWAFSDTDMAVGVSAEGGLPIQIGGENPQP
jgi:hypothetical protein